MCKRYKHKITGNIVEQISLYKNEQFYVNIQLDKLINIPSWIVENSNDWELVKEKEWEVISFKFISELPCFANIQLNGKYASYDPLTQINYGSSLDEMLSAKDWRIYSIRRLFDNEIFTLGDKIQIKESYQETKEILSFSEDEYGYYINGVELNRIEKVTPKVLFITEDKVEKYEGDYCCNVTPGWLLCTFLVENYHTKNKLNKTFKYFSTKDKAQEYIDLNKPQYSLQDIKNACRESGNWHLGHCLALMEKLIRK